MVYGAQDDMLFCSYLLGAVGAISAILTAFPSLCVEQWDAVQSGDIARAREIHFRLQAVWRIVGEAGMCFHSRVKAILALQGRQGGVAREPALEPPPEVLTGIRQALEEAGLLDPASKPELDPANLI
jgi:4-hydroxy-tetrahydrodipicolinate synthase